MKLKKFLAIIWLPLALVLVFCICDPILTRENPVKDSRVFFLNDFELTQRQHPEEIWHNVFWGNSVVISCYDEAESASGYVNLGLDYGVIRDLQQMLSKGYGKVDNEIILGLNYLCFYDDFETNPTYIWHKKWYQPYFYFQRDRFYPLITEGIANVIQGKDFTEHDNREQGKALYYGVLSKEDQEAQLKAHAEKYWNLPLSEFEENLAALDQVLAFCREEGIAVRAIWMPWNPNVPIPQIQYDVEAAANPIFAKYGVEVTDAKDDFSVENFHDVAHFNVETGRINYTKEFDKWVEN